MRRVYGLISVSSLFAGMASASAQTEPAPQPPPPTLPGITVTATKMDEERSSILPSLGATKYDFSRTAIQNTPQGENAPLNQVLLRAPGVVQDGFGQIHVRGDHGSLQYRLDGVQLPEGLALFSQILSPRFANSLSLLTGALPAQYGLRTAGVVDIGVKSGTTNPGAEALVHGRLLQLGAAVGGVWRAQRQYRLLRRRPVPQQQHRHRKPVLGVDSHPRPDFPVVRPRQGHGHRRREYTDQLHRRRRQRELPDSQQHQPGSQLHGIRQLDLGQLDPRPAPMGEHLLRPRLAAEDLRGLQHAALGLCALFPAQLPARRDRRPPVQRRRALGAAHQLRHRRAGRRELEGGTQAYAARRLPRPARARHELCASQYPAVRARCRRSRQSRRCARGRARRPARRPHRLCRSDRLDLQRLPAGRMEGAADTDRECRFALRCHHQPPQRVPVQPARQYRLGAHAGNQPARRIRPLLRSRPVEPGLRRLASGACRHGYRPRGHDQRSRSRRTLR